MTVSCISNGSKKILLWAGASCASFYVVANIARGVLKVGQAYLDYPKEVVPRNQSRMFTILLSGFFVPVLVVLPFRKVAVCATLLAYGVLWGLAELYRFKRAADKKRSDSPFKTHHEASEFHRLNNELIAKGNIKEAREACIQYIQPYLNSHPNIRVSFIASSTENNPDMLFCSEKDDAAIRAGVLYSVETCNYSLLICLSLMRSIPFVIGSCKTLEQKNLKQYKLFCEIFDSHDVDYFCLWMLLICRPKSEDLRLFWLSKMSHVKFPNIRQLCSREKGFVLKDSNKLSSFALKRLLIEAVMSQSKEYLIFLIGQGAEVNFTYGPNNQMTLIWDLITRDFHHKININFLDLLVQYGADLHFQHDGFSILDSLLLCAHCDYLRSRYPETSNEWKIISYLIKKSVKYDSTYVPDYLSLRVAELRSSLALH